MTEDKRQRNHDRFLSSMTFASPPIKCDCDECGMDIFIPPSVSEAVMEHKKRKLLKETAAFQERNLVIRDSGVSIWELRMPPGSEPLIEFGGSHRIVLVKSMVTGRNIFSIGKGIIGSADEENSRWGKSWLENRGYIYWSNGGKAIGWINKKQESDKRLKVSDTAGDVVLYVIKATIDVVSQWSGNMDGDSWISKVLNIFQKYLQKGSNSKLTEQESRTEEEELIPSDSFTLFQLVLNSVASKSP